MSQVELRNISKSFGGVRALKDVTLKANAGEIHALIGENGAGKSTLMKILSGAYRKDSGKIFFNDQEVDIRNTHDSKKLGIGIIYQEFSLIPELSVAENIFLDQLANNRFWMNLKELRERARHIIEDIGFDIDPSAKVGSLSIAQQQIVEIAKALSNKVNTLILDEPSAVLGLHEVQKLFSTLYKLRDDGVAIIYISHHFSEIFQISNRITVLKDGVSSDSMATSETNRDEIIKVMLGRSLDTMFPDRHAVIGDEVLNVENIYTSNNVNGVSLSLRAGEVLGIAGLVGSGRTETARAIFAADSLKKGTINWFGRSENLSSSHKAVKFGVGMVPEDRKKQGVILDMSVKNNISLPNLKGVSNKLGFITKQKEKTQSTELIDRLRIKTPNENVPVSNLSGGNQQKVAIAKWLTQDCKVMLIDEPTRGVDLGAKVEIYNVINELSQKGVATLVISSETAELMGICDRILVMREGKVQGELLKDEFSEEAILRLSLNASEDSDSPSTV